jgi:hypothetical protein
MIITKEIEQREEDEELRDEIRMQPNGYYAIQICRKCRGHLHNPTGDVRTAKIVEQCAACYSKTL